LHDGFVGRFMQARDRAAEWDRRSWRRPLRGPRRRVRTR
jgi:hypothetical protein